MRKAGQLTFSTWHRLKSLKIIPLRQAHWESLIKPPSNVTVNVDFYASIDKKAEKALKEVHWKRRSCCLAVRGEGVPWLGGGWEQVVFFCPYAHQTSKLTQLTVRKIIVVCFKCFFMIFRHFWELFKITALYYSSIYFFFLRQERGSTFVISLSYRKSQHQTGRGSMVWHIVKTNNWLLSTAPIPFLIQNTSHFHSDCQFIFSAFTLAFTFDTFNFSDHCWFCSHCKGINNFIHIC